MKSDTTRSTRYTIDEVKALARHIEELSMYYRPPIERLHAYFPLLLRLGFSMVDFQTSKMLIVVDIVRQYPIILDEHIKNVPDSIVSLQLLWFDIADQLPDKIVEHCFKSGGVTWFTIPDRDRVIISTRYNEDELVNRWLDHRFKSKWDHTGTAISPCNQGKGAIL